MWTESAELHAAGCADAVRIRLWSRQRPVCAVARQTSAFILCSDEEGRAVTTRLCQLPRSSAIVPADVDASGTVLLTTADTQLLIHTVHDGALVQTTPDVPGGGKVYAGCAAWVQGLAGSDAAPHAVCITSTSQAAVYSMAEGEWLPGVGLASPHAFVACAGFGGVPGAAAGVVAGTSASRAYILRAVPDAGFGARPLSLVQVVDLHPPSTRCGSLVQLQRLEWDGLSAAFRAADEGDTPADSTALPLLRASEQHDLPAWLADSPEQPRRAGFAKPARAQSTPACVILASFAQGAVVLDPASWTCTHVLQAPAAAAAASATAAPLSYAALSAATPAAGNAWNTAGAVPQFGSTATALQPLGGQALAVHGASAWQVHAAGSGLPSIWQPLDSPLSPSPSKLMPSAATACAGKADTGPMGNPFDLSAVPASSPLLAITVAPKRKPQPKPGHRLPRSRVASSGYGAAQPWAYAKAARGDTERPAVPTPASSTAPSLQWADIDELDPSLHAVASIALSFQARTAASDRRSDASWLGPVSKLAWAGGRDVIAAVCGDGLVRTLKLQPWMIGSGPQPADESALRLLPLPTGACLRDPSSRHIQHAAWSTRVFAGAGAKILEQDTRPGAPVRTGASAGVSRGPEAPLLLTHTDATWGLWGADTDKPLVYVDFAGRAAAKAARSASAAGARPTARVRPSSGASAAARAVSRGHRAVARASARSPTPKSAVAASIAAAGFMVADTKLWLCRGATFSMWGWQLAAARGPGSAQCVARLELDIAPGSRLCAGACASAPASRAVYLASSDKQVHVLDAGTMQAVASAPAPHPRTPHAVLVPAGTVPTDWAYSFFTAAAGTSSVADGRGSGSALLWDARDLRRPQGSLAGHAHRTHHPQLSWSPCARFLATGGEDGPVACYDVRMLSSGTAAPVALLDDARGACYGVAWSARRPALATGALDGVVRLYSAGSQQVL